MPQYDLYRNPNPETQETFPFLVDVQADLLEELETRTVIPLSHAVALTTFPMLQLMPIVAVEGKAYAVVTPQLAGIARVDLGSPAGSLAGYKHAISTALDLLVRGF